MREIIIVIDWILFIYVAMSVAYLCFFAFLSLLKSSEPYPKSDKKSPILILFPAYKEDKVIESSVQSILTQDYPKEYFHIMIISDQMQETTIRRLSKLPLQILSIVNDRQTKANALQLAVSGIDKNAYEIVVILDADNSVEPDFLSRVNDAYQFGIYAMQAQRIAKNPQTDTALLDGASEAMNNSFFRKGQTRIGLSAALSGSGMAFDFGWFKEHILKVSTAGEDKELEVLLLKQGFYIDYLEKAIVYDEKIVDPKSFSRQRRRWLAAQFGALKQAIKEFPIAIINRNWDYCNKLFQWMMLPRVLLLGIISLLAFVFTIFHWPWSLKWWGLLLGLIIAFSIALPDELFDKRLKKALRKIPLLFFLMFINLFRLKGANRKFIHTRHGN
ncbi:MAG: glycosyltransferase family 2 protein [Proteiniphilum sp.]|uniref:glycosyltransferase n=1 Tax=Proteiniphilum sp. TaxID=1926877 RepID=UPI002B20D3BB|nr:glycosyltransferase family 2 protein [Proteiniphilum sp.]MEA5129462.1 glycosyltransferase family 2 protein [Proteiniphilum sp.]